MTAYPLSAVRALALHAQLLDRPAEATPTPSLDSIYNIIHHLGAVQIDTLQMVARAHYLAVWSRLGNYDPILFDQLFSQERKIFEDWYHAACYIPMHEYRYQLPRQHKTRIGGHHWYADWINEPGNREMVAAVTGRIRAEGGLRASDFDNPDHRRGSWWDWKPAKVALEYAYSYGDLMIAERVKFQRVYDLTERVLPAGVDTNEPTDAERDRFWVERGAKALGVSLPRNPGDYTWMGVGKSRRIVAELVKAGVLVEIQGETMTDIQTLIVHHDNLPLLEQAASGRIRPQRTTFLNPFDNFWWAQDRDEVFWEFRHTLEAYVPAAKRVYGYFCLPILHKDRLVGRFDPKLERKNHLLRLRALYLEPGVKADEELVSDVAGTMRDFMKFHQADDLVIENSQPKVFAKKLLKSL